MTERERVIDRYREREIKRLIRREKHGKIKREREEERKSKKGLILSCQNLTAFKMKAFLQAVCFC